MNIIRRFLYKCSSKYREKVVKDLIRDAVFNSASETLCKLNDIEEVKSYKFDSDGNFHAELICGTRIDIETHIEPVANVF